MKVQWIKLMKSGDLEQETNEETGIPSVGDGKMLDQVGFGVKGHVFTPHLESEYHFFVYET